MNKTIIRSNVVVERSIRDKNIVVGEGCRLGAVVEGKRPAIVVVGKNTRLSAGMRIGAGAVIGCDMNPQDFPRRVIGKGSSLTLNTH